VARPALLPKRSPSSSRAAASRHAHCPSRPRNIQADRGHQVVENGPYAYLRHPGYAGAILFTLGTPILLNSIPAFVLAVVTTLITVLRTYLEDRTLRKELHGYEQYAQTVRYRLIPLVW
jgi:protein-S-isoprenylcysteine O-methyltransferase Ste14